MDRAEEPVSSASGVSDTLAPSDAGHKLLPPDPDAADADTAPTPTTTTTTTNNISDGNSNRSSNNADPATRPLVICFHGSGESCSPAWDALAGALTASPHRLRVLLYNRGPPNPRPPRATRELREFLRRERIGGPCVLVAHSYGGAFARTFLELEGQAETETETEGKGVGEEDCGAKGEGVGGAEGGSESEGVKVVGMVLVETGQEGGLDDALEKRQYARRVLGTRPLSVVRGNSLIRQWRELEAAEAEAGAQASAAPEDEARWAGLRSRRETLVMWDRVDEGLKKKQLDLARGNARKRFVHVPDCGHDVVRDRPDVVAEQVAWVLENVGRTEGDGDEPDEEEEGCGKGGGRWRKVRMLWRSCKGYAERLWVRLRR